MRQTVKGLVAAFAVVTASAAPAMACGGWSSCGSPCGGYYVSRCGGYGILGGSYASYGYGYGYGYQTVPAPQYYAVSAPQYAYVAQGPTYSGPGNFAPYPTYQEAAVTGYGNYYRSTSYPYDGGRYADATTHYYDGAPARPHFRPWRPRTSFYGHSRPRVSYGPQYSAGPRWHRPVLRRYY